MCKKIVSLLIIVILFSFLIYSVTSNYTPSASSAEFIDVNSGNNGTTVHTTTPTFNWTITSASKYNLQIANDSTFTDLVVNITNITEYDYASCYSANETRVSFTLPAAYALPTTYKKYYCRVRSLGRI